MRGVFSFAIWSPINKRSSAKLHILLRNIHHLKILHKIHTISTSLSRLNVNLSFILINKTNGPRPRHNFLEFLICWTLSQFTQSIYTLVQVGFNASTIRECRFLKRKKRKWLRWEYNRHFAKRIDLEIWQVKDNKLILRLLVCMLHMAGPANINVWSSLNLNSYQTLQTLGEIKKPAVKSDQ